MIGRGLRRYVLELLVVALRRGGLAATPGSSLRFREASLLLDRSSGVRSRVLLICLRGYRRRGWIVVHWVLILLVTKELGWVVNNPLL